MAGMSGASVPTACTSLPQLESVKPVPAVHPDAVDHQRLGAVGVRGPLDLVLVQVEARNTIDDPVEELEAVGVAHRDHDSAGDIGGCAGVSILRHTHPSRAVCVPPQAK
jgi:hypothetical protein